jgi:hypothetical protein
MNEELTNGDMVRVSDLSVDRALICKNKFRFVGETRTAYAVEKENGEVVVFGFAVKVPEPKLVPWTFETCPLPPFCIQRKEHKNLLTVISVTELYMCTKHTHTFKELFKDYDYVVSREDIRPCGEVK